MRKKQKPCNKVGCYNLTTTGYCDTHQHLAEQGKLEYQKRYNTQRDKEHTSFYATKQWQQLRELVLQRDHYLCVECKANNIVTPARIVDHITERKDNDTLRADIDNLQSLCGKCHSIKTHREKKRRNNQ